MEAEERNIKIPAEEYHGFESRCHGAESAFALLSQAAWPAQKTAHEAL